MKMFKTKRTILHTILFVATLTTNVGYAQSRTEANLIGSQIPNHTFTRVKNYQIESGVKQLSMDDLKHKWAVLYFWTRSCTPCIKSFPKLNEIQKDFGSEIQVLLVGINDMWNPNTESFFEGVKAAQNINLPIAYDTVLVKKLQIIYASTVVIVSPSGKIVDVSSGSELTKKRVKDILKKE